MKNYLLPAWVLFVVIQIPGPAWANFDLHYLGPLDSTIDPSQFAAAQGDFVVGQRLPVAGYAVDEMHSSTFPYFPNYYIVPFCPSEMAAVPCAAGWRIDAVHFVFASEMPEPMETVLRFDLAEGYGVDELFQGLTMPWTDGVESLLPQLEVPGSGYFELVMPTPDWGCLHLDYWYGISQTRMPFNGEPWPYLLKYAVADGLDFGCLDLRSYTMGAIILFDGLEIPGDLVMWVDASCCENPVAVEAVNWGGMKARYR